MVSFLVRSDQVFYHINLLFNVGYLQFCSSANTSDTTVRGQTETNFTTVQHSLRHLILFMVRDHFGSLRKSRFMWSEQLKYHK